VTPHDALPPLEVGIFARTFTSASLADTLSAVSALGFRALHFNLACAGLPLLPDDLDRAPCATIRDAFARHRIQMVGVSATYNTIHPDCARRYADTQRARRVIALSPVLGTRLVSLSTGTRDAENMWRGHRGNDAPDAWRDLLDTLASLVEVAEDAGVVLGVEPERNNVVSSARRAVRLLEEMRTPHLRIILDPANLVNPASPGSQHDILAEAFELLAPSTVMLHAKDVAAAGHVAAGLGWLDYGHIFELIGRHHLTCPIIIHDVAPADVPRARAFVEGLAAPVRMALEASAG
jgi:sugar phosphate isomerase/epimerase